MTPKRVLISVEGQTEETFIREVLSEYLGTKGIFLISTLLTTKIVKSGSNFRGGVSTYGKIKSDIKKLLNDTNATAVTTMYDLYGLPSDFPGYATRPPTNPYHKVAHLEQAFAKDISHRRFKPYLQLHEFETFLFVVPTITQKTLQLDSSQLAQLHRIKTNFQNNPEHINDSPNTAPSKRLLRIYDAYDKTADGPYVTKELGLQKLRASCSHFDEWVQWLENL